MPVGSTASVESTLGYGTKFSYSEDGGSTYTEIANVQKIKPPDEEVNDVKKTGLNSPDRTHEYKPGLIEPGLVEITLYFKASVTDTLYGLRLREDLTFRITYPDGNSTGSKLDFDGYMKGIKNDEIEAEGDVMQTFTFKVTGLADFTQGS